MRISDWSSDVCSSDLAGSQPSVGHDLAGHDADSAGASHQSGRGSGDYGRSRLRFLQHLRPAAEARPVSNTAVLENALLPLRPLLARRSEEHTSELQSLMRISYAVFCLKKKKKQKNKHHKTTHNQQTQRIT